MDFTNIVDSFTGTIGGYLPVVIGAVAVLIIGWFVARIFRGVTKKVLKKTDLDNKLFRGKSSSFSSEDFISKLVYYLVLMIVLMVVLEMLGVHNVLDPVKDMVQKFLGFVPNLIAAGIIGFAGYIIATLASEVIGFASEKIESFANRMGLSENMDVPKLVKQLVFIIVFIPILITALDTLQLKAISEPATQMLSTFINVIPNIIAAAIIIGVFYIGGRYLVTIGTELLRNIGTDDFSTKLGLTQIIGEKQSLSKLIANTAFFFLMFTAIITAMEILHFGRMSTVLSNLLEMTGQIFFGLVVLAIGSFVANFAHKALTQTKGNEFIAGLAKVVILGLFFAISLRTMGIANDIVNLAFGLTLGAVAIAFALSFGLGGREAAGKQMDYILKKFRKED